MNRTKLQIEATAMLLGILLISVWFNVENVQARCKWVWRGANSYYVCDEDQEWRKGVSICDFSTTRDRKGIPKTVTVFCRPDGSPWKEVIVGPARVVVKDLRRDGSVKEKKKIDIARQGPPTTERAERRKPPNEKPKWKNKNWQTTVMGMKVTGQVQRKQNNIQGFLKIPMPFTGKRKTYTFKGHINGNNVVARSGGHSFRGKIRPDGKVSGTVNIDGGPNVPLVSPFTLP